MLALIETYEVSQLAAASPFSLPWTNFSWPTSRLWTCRHRLAGLGKARASIKVTQIAYSRKKTERSGMKLQLTSNSGTLTSV
jgi:hypothetical protein